VFFRAREFKTAWNMIKSMFYLQTDGVKILDNFSLIKIGVLIALLFVSHWFMRNTSLKELSLKIPSWVLGVFWAVMCFLIIISQGSGEQFIYFQF
jgi:alginate O-acetyltransferase complex protein AlgI